MEESNIGYDEGTGRWEVLVKYNGDIADVAKEVGAGVEVLGNGFAILTLPSASIPRLSSFPQIISIERPRLLTHSLYDSLLEACVTQVHQDDALSGRGVLVAILDSGIEYTHPDFINEDGTSRIAYVWDQLAIPGPGLQPPTGWDHGVEYSAQQLDAAINGSGSTVPALDTIGHGTAVAGSAAGNGRASGGRQKGVAPEATIIAVRLGERGRQSFARTTELMRALRYVTDKAIALGMPLCVNISFGTNDGPHDTSSLFTSFINSIAEEWQMVIVVASGNEGAAGHHYVGFLSQGEVRDVDIFISSSRAYITIWKDFSDTMEFELVSPSGTSSGRLSALIPHIDTSLDGTNVIGILTQPTHYTLDQNIHYEMYAPGGRIMEGMWSVRIRALSITNGRVDMWLPTVEEVSQDTFFAEPENEGTLTIPSTATGVITVGAYDALRGSIANFSGRGFAGSGGPGNNTAEVKPDMVAPGVGVVAPSLGGGYDSFTGTSIAAPIVTGCAAIMMQWGIVEGHDPFLYGQRAKAYLRLGARRSADTSYPNEVWGYGRVCLYNTIRALKSPL